MNRKLGTYCGSVMEEHEEDLAQGLMAEKIDGPGGSDGSDGVIVYYWLREIVAAGGNQRC